MKKLLNRHRSIIDFALSSLLRRKVRNAALLAVYTLIVFVIASLIFFVNALKREASITLKGAPDMVVQRMIAGRQDLMPISHIGQIAALPGVGTVTPRLWGYYFDPALRANLTVMVHDMGGSPSKGKVFIGSGVARLKQMKADDSLRLILNDQPTLLMVEKVMPLESELLASDLIVMSPEDFRSFFHFPKEYATDLAIYVQNPRESATIAGKIAGIVPEARVIQKSTLLQTYDSIFNWRSGMITVILFTAVLCFVILAWDKATGLSAEEKREIGILKSIGWDTSDVLYLKFWEGMAISMTAFLAGYCLAYAHVFFFSASLFEHALKGWAILYPRFRLAPAIDPYHVSVLFFLTVLPYTSATIIPAWLAATAEPDAAMRT